MAYTIATIIVVIDQVTKALVEANIDYGTSIRVIDRFFYLVNTRNTGAAWSLFSDLTFSRLLLSAISLLAAYLIALALKKAETRAGRVLLGVVLGGTVGNLIDRVRLGYVTDFFSFIFGTFHFPAFNVADMAITLGALFIVFYSLSDRHFIDRLFPWLDKKEVEPPAEGLEQSMRDALNALDQDRKEE